VEANKQVDGLGYFVCGLGFYILSFASCNAEQCVAVPIAEFRMPISLRECEGERRGGVGVEVEGYEPLN